MIATPRLRVNCESIEIDWPSGRKQKHDVTTLNRDGLDRTVTVQEGGSEVSPTQNAGSTAEAALDSCVLFLAIHDAQAGADQFDRVSSRHYFKSSCFHQALHFPVQVSEFLGTEREFNRLCFARIKRHSLESP